MRSQFRIIKTRCNQYFIQKKWLCFWLTHRPIKSPTYMDTFHHAELEIKKIKQYQKSKQEIVWQG